VITTLNKIREHSPCSIGWRTLLCGLGKTDSDDEPLSIADILEHNDLDDALWCLRAVDGHLRERRLLAVYIARQVVHLAAVAGAAGLLELAERLAPCGPETRVLGVPTCPSTAPGSAQHQADWAVIAATDWSWRHGGADLYWVACEAGGALAAAADEAYVDSPEIAAWTARETFRTALEAELRRVCAECAAQPEEVA